MLSLDDLLKFAEIKKIPLTKRRGIVREYLQILTLSYIQQANFAPKMLFIGGTALRFFHDLQRFSEDLDFNYLGTLKKNDVTKLLRSIKREFEKESITVNFSIRKSRETYFHWKIYLQFPNILQYYQCTGKKGHTLHPLETLSLQLDLQNLGKKKYPILKKIISHFGKRFLFNTTNLNMFLAEKSHAMLYRRPARGRDFFDFMSLVHWNAKIALNYLRQRDIPVKNKSHYIKKIKNRVQKLEFKTLTKQLAPFLFQVEDIEIMKHFPDHIDDLYG